MTSRLIVIGGGLAGTEAAWQAAEQGIDVTLYEMRPQRNTPAHITDQLAELICSNSLGSNLPDRASGLLKAELRLLNSLIMRVADETAVPAGGALAVDRNRFAQLITERITQHPHIELRRAEVTIIPQEPCIIASGPLTADDLANDIAHLTGQQHLYFYDAIAPIVEADTIDMTIVFRQSRYERAGAEHAEGDYLNCPFTKEEYGVFIDALVSAERIELRDFEREDAKFFEGCLPIEVLAKRGHDALAFGPMKPIGLRDPRTGKGPYAVVQLRQDNLAGTLYNIVGFQTNLKWPEQKRVFRLIPGLANAEFMRYGMMHRNTFINSPRLLYPTMQFRTRADLFFAGQITGVEGYIGNAASGLVAGLNAARLLRGEALIEFPATTMLGALCHYVTHADPEDFQPMKANYGILPPLENAPRGKRDRFRAFSQRAMRDMQLAVSRFA
ncbi:MAG TPA: methylenetetrahydrofolate--tRNA-(uracil(54)-C(5))-methyltransferase (FADH(2)-oxidizing) TrmFO [Anaerolineae bacterium]|nr:methylenetetrahydrofolate--tRNA-(uracil(54)-C(5))-methyltransferase (FADH(2)-oxidizing) TrmFO [Anaerolineae bacterium]